MIADAPVQAIINKTPHPKQRYALWLLGLDPNFPPPPNGPVNELLFGGMSNGGKSQLIRFVLTIIAQMWPGSKVAVFRKSSKDLMRTQVMPLLKEIPDNMINYDDDGNPTGSVSRLGRFNGNQGVYLWENGSVTEFNYCWESEDHLRFKSYEWDVIIFDEATEFPEAQLTFLRSRCKSTAKGWYPIIIYATNPGGPGHLYLKQNFVTTRESGIPFWGPWEATEAGLELINGEDFRYRRCYLRSRLADNPSLSPAQALAGLAGISDPELRRAMAEGDWDLHAGQFFSDFKERNHVCEPFEIPKDWIVWRAVDYGSSDPAACIWAARDPKATYLRTYIFRYWQAAGLTARAQANMIVNLSYNDPPAHMTLCDPSMMNKTRGAEGQTPAQEYASKPAHLMLTKANNRRPAGWARVRRSLVSQETYGPNFVGDPSFPPELQIFKHTDLTGTAPLIRWLANVEYDKNDSDDVQQPRNLTDSVNDLRDEPGDTLRYLLQGAAAVSRPPSRPRHWGYRTETPEPRRRR